MIKLQPDPTFQWPVPFKTPKGELTLNLTFRHMTTEEHDKWWEAAVQRYIAHRDALTAYTEQLKALPPGEAAPEAPKPEKTALDEVMELVVGWDGVDAEFSREAMGTMLLNYHDLSAKKICEAWSAGLTQRRLEN